MAVPLETMKKVSSGGKVVVEAAHYYVDKGLDHEALLGAQVAIDLVNVMTGWGVQVESMLFVDDIRKSSEKLDISLALATLNDCGFNPTQIVYESGMVAEGYALIEQLIQTGKTKKHAGRLKLKNGFFPILGKAGDSNMPSCEVLDAVLYQAKLKSGTGAVTLLPESYYSQQTKTRSVLEAFGVLLPNVLVVCYDHQGEITKTQYWGE